MRLVTPTVALAARRVAYAWGDPSSFNVTEIVHEVFLKICEDDRKILREFEDRGHDSFLKLMRMIAASVGTDYFRRIRAEKRGGRMQTVSLDAQAMVEKIADTRSAGAEWPILMAQLDDLLRRDAVSVSDRDRTLFWLYYRQGLAAEAISRIPAIGLTPKGVESALRRLTKLLRDMILASQPNPDLLLGKTISSTNCEPKKLLGNCCD
ncbi:sigma-70 family RNA polymerase sigma factor [Acidicapsa ligni]|uniref:sigma-70 family RNA polymerase sigma factor n=1 Tax=Acidicapsa ligni TaxID=542300 RepID=UPI0021E0ADB8|nr:sigma-70 family RNA polymerase sigma factor [Acidicapsa ligni]